MSLPIEFNDRTGETIYANLFSATDRRKAFNPTTSDFVTLSASNEADVAIILEEDSVRVGHYKYTISTVTNIPATSDGSFYLIEVYRALGTSFDRSSDTLMGTLAFYWDGESEVNVCGRESASSPAPSPGNSLTAQEVWEYSQRTLTQDIQAPDIYVDIENPDSLTDIEIPECPDNSEEIEALKAINLTVNRGEFLGIIGHNGAGKSTLLRTIAGILPPSNGRVSVYGDVTTLLSVGIGFNPQLTGRDNIRLSALANGYSTKEIAKKEDEIAEFSELGEFINYPMKTYSSGMYSRLGFAVVSHMDPDILLIDEALSAGDAAFREKAAARIQIMMEKASAILLVSHGLKTVTEMATKCLWLDHGEMMGLGNCDEVVEAYKESVRAGKSTIANEEI